MNRVSTTMSLALAVVLPLTGNAGVGETTHIYPIRSAFDLISSVDFYPLVAEVSSTRSGKDLLTQIDDSASQSVSATGVLMIEPVVQLRPGFRPKALEVIKQMDQSMRSAFDRIEFLAAKPNGWKGVNTLAAKVEACVDVIAVVEKLIDSFSGYMMPDIGLDAEGIFSLSWNQPPLMACVSVYGDGTFSCFARRGERSFSADSETIAGPLPDALIRLLRA